MESVYIETTIVSYFVSRPSRDLLVTAHQQATYDWWTARRSGFECFVSQAVVDEIIMGDPEAAAKRMEILGSLPLLAATEEAERLTSAILSAGAMPSLAVRDALHIAIAAVNDIDYLLTWNCKHLANAQMIRRVSIVCIKNGYNMPVICTPEELMGD